MVEAGDACEPRVIELSKEWLKLGKLETLDIIKQHKECLAKKDWPYRYAGMGIDVMEPPGWVSDKFGSHQKITIGDEQF
jgi:hypothetical protein